jgi:hypothetical protein
VNRGGALVPLALVAAVAADGIAIAMASRTECGHSSAVPAIFMAVTGGIVAGTLLFTALRPRSAVAAGVASVLVAVVVSLVGAVAVFAQGVGCLN